MIHIYVCIYPYIRICMYTSILHLHVLMYAVQSMCVHIHLHACILCPREVECTAAHIHTCTYFDVSEKAVANTSPELRKQCFIIYMHGYKYFTSKDNDDIHAHGCTLIVNNLVFMHMNVYAYKSCVSIVIV